MEISDCFGKIQKFETFFKNFQNFKNFGIRYLKDASSSLGAALVSGKIPSNTGNGT